MGGTIDKLARKDILKKYFDILAAAAANNKCVLEQLMTAIESLKNNNESVNNTGKPLRYHRDDSVVAFWYY